MKKYVKQIKMLSLYFKKMNSIFSDWIILTVFLNNLESSFNAFTTVKWQTIWIYISFFNVLMTELIDESWINDNKFSVIMIFYSNNIFMFFKQCFYCKRISYEELMCWNKYLHKKKKFEATKKKKNEKSDEFSDEFSDNFTLNFVEIRRLCGDFSPILT